MGIRVYQVLPAQANTPDNITSNIRYNIAGDKKIVEFTQMPSPGQDLLNHIEAFELMQTEDWNPVNDIEDFEE